MSRGRIATRPAPAGPVGRRLRRLGSCVLVLALAGCASQPAFDNDPLVGGRPLPRTGAAAPPRTGVAAAPAAPPAPANPLQLPSPYGATSPAALAAAGSPSADASALRIGPPPTAADAGPPQPGALTSAPRDGGDPWQNSGASAGAVLKQPQPIADASVRPIAAITPPTTGAPAAAAPPSAGQYEQLQDALAQRGVLFQSLVGPDEHGVWRFSCGVPSRDKAGETHCIELSAPGDRGLAAVRAVVDQIDRYQHGG